MSGYNREYIRKGDVLLDFILVKVRPGNISSLYIRCEMN